MNQRFRAITTSFFPCLSWTPSDLEWTGHLSVFWFKTAVSTEWFPSKENRHPLFLISWHSPHPHTPAPLPVYSSYLLKGQKSALAKIPVDLHFILSHHRTPLEGFCWKRGFLSCFTLKCLQRRVLTQAAAMEMSDKFCFMEQSSELCEESRCRQCFLVSLLAN